MPDSSVSIIVLPSISISKWALNPLWSPLTKTVVPGVGGAGYGADSGTGYDSGGGARLVVLGATGYPMLGDAGSEDGSVTVYWQLRLRKEGRKAQGPAPSSGNGEFHEKLRLRVSLSAQE